MLSTSIAASESGRAIKEVSQSPNEGISKTDSKFSPNEITAQKGMEHGFVGSDKELSNLDALSKDSQDNDNKNLENSASKGIEQNTLNESDQKSEISDKQKEIYEKNGVDINNPQTEVLAGKEVTVYKNDNIDPNLEDPDGKTNKQRMEEGNAPYILKDGKLEKVELHHHGQKDDGPLVELDRKTHNGDYNQELHPGQGKGDGRGTDPLWDQKRNEHWQNRAQDF